MPALSFQKQFATKVEAKEKRQTIRRKRADGRDPKPGQTLYLYTGLRTRSCRKLGEEICKQSLLIYIDQNETIVAGQLLSLDEERRLAQDDGFECISDFRAFFLQDSNQYFEGYLIKW